MPVIVIGADTPSGTAIVGGLIEPGREVRAFVTDVDSAAALKGLGVKVAIGDVSDETHIEGAATRCFSAVLVGEAATDDRERSFARDPASVHRAWSRGIAASGVRRAIWVIDGDPPESSVSEIAVVSPGEPDLVQRVVAIDDVRTLDELSGG
jgi:nucleoside-diphosphate-sugar epimerase